MAKKNPAAFFITPSVKVDEVSFSLAFVQSFNTKSDFVRETKHQYYLDRSAKDRKVLLEKVYELANKNG